MAAFAAMTGLVGLWWTKAWMVASSATMTGQAGGCVLAKDG
jgi:hypothetical protein